MTGWQKAYNSLPQFILGCRICLGSCRFIILSLPSQPPGNSEYPPKRNLGEEFDLGTIELSGLTFLDDDINGADGMSPGCNEDSAIILNNPVSQ